MKNNVFKRFSLGISWLWLLVFALLPYVLIFIASFLTHDASHLIQAPLTINNYVSLVNNIYLHIFIRSFLLAGICTLICLVIAYPFAYLLSRTHKKYKNFLLLLVIIPFWTSSLVRSYAIMAILKAKGILNTFLLTLGIIHMPLQLLYTNTAVIIGLVYNLLPFMILPLYANIERLNTYLIEAARDLGAHRFTIFSRIIIPLTFPGILAGCLIVFLPAMTLFYIPDLLGGAKSMLLGNLIQDQFLFAGNWPQGAAISIVLTLFMAILLWVYWKNSRAKDRMDLL